MVVHGLITDVGAFLWRLLDGLKGCESAVSVRWLVRETASTTGNDSAFCIIDCKRGSRETSHVILLRLH